MSDSCPAFFSPAFYRSAVCLSVCLSDDVGATAFFPASFSGSTAVDSPTWAPVGAPQYVPADLLPSAAATPVIVAGDAAPSQPPPPHHHQQVPAAQPVHVLQPYPQHVGVVAGPPPTHQPAPHHHPAAGYLQQPAPVPAHLQVSVFSDYAPLFARVYTVYGCRVNALINVLGN